MAADDRSPQTSSTTASSLLFKVSFSREFFRASPEGRIGAHEFFRNSGKVRRNANPPKNYGSIFASF